MRWVRRVLATLFAIAFALLGLPAVKDAIANIGTWGQEVRGHLDDPFVYIALIVFSVLLLTTAATDVLLERRLANAGGPTKREFPVRLRHWAGINAFKLDQAAWLWNGLEPNSGSFESTVVYPTRLRMQQTLDAGALGKDIKPGPAGWFEMSFTRQQLVDLAYALGDAPRFLFPLRLRKLVRAERIDPDDSYRRLHSVEYELLQVTKAENPEVTDNDARAAVRGWLISGKWAALARERVDGVLHRYVRIPPAAWQRARMDFYTLHIDGREFEDVRIRYVEG